MSALAEGKAVFRRWDEEKGLLEWERPFSSLAELLTLSRSESEVRKAFLDSIQLQGEDASGQPCTLTLGLKSLRLLSGAVS